MRPLAVGEWSAAGIRSLDEILAGETPPFVIKIDVDGGELDVLRSGATVLRDHDCSLIVETHSAELERSCIALSAGSSATTRR